MAPKKTAAEEAAEQNTPVLDMAAVQALVAQAVAAEREKIKAEMEAEEEAKKAARKAADEAGEELVPVRLFRDSKNYKDDVFVAVNGENVLIKRGEDVMIKRKFAEVLDNSDKQSYAAAVLMDELKSQYEDSRAKHNM